MHCKLKDWKSSLLSHTGKEVLIISSLARSLTLRIGSGLLSKTICNEGGYYAKLLLGIYHWRQAPIPQKLGSPQKNQRLLVGLDLDMSIQPMRVYSLNLNRGLLIIQVSYGCKFLRQSTFPRCHLPIPPWSTSQEFRTLNPNYSTTLLGRSQTGRALIFLMIVGLYCSHKLSKSHSRFKKI